MYFQFMCQCICYFVGDAAFYDVDRIQITLVLAICRIFACYHRKINLHQLKHFCHYFYNLALVAA